MDIVEALDENRVYVVTVFNDLCSISPLVDLILDVDFALLRTAKSRRGLGVQNLGRHHSAESAAVRAYEGHPPGPPSPP